MSSCRYFAEFGPGDNVALLLLTDAYHDKGGSRADFEAQVTAVRALRKPPFITVQTVETVGGTKRCLENPVKTAKRS